MSPLRWSVSHPPSLTVVDHPCTTHRWVAWDWPSPLGKSSELGHLHESLLLDLAQPLHPWGQLQERRTKWMETPNGCRHLVNWTQINYATKGLMKESQDGIVVWELGLRPGNIRGEIKPRFITFWPVVVSPPAHWGMTPNMGYTPCIPLATLLHYNSLRNWHNSQRTSTTIGVDRVHLTELQASQ